jgi:two-component system sensor histidine kinase/response regulator
MTNADKAVPSPSILLVDDTVENLRLLAGMLATRGFDTRPVTSGAEALAAIAHEIPDLILLDVTMPGMNGFEVCARVRERPECHDVPIIFLTALTDVSDKVKGFAAGGVDFITKPFHVEEVVARVTTHVALRRSRQELAESFTRLQALEKSRDDLVKMIVHDMRGLLTVVLANLELARPDITGEAAADVDAAVRAANDVTHMSNTLLDVSRLEEGKMPLNRAPCDLAAVARESRDSMSALDTTRTIEVVAAGPVTASCDQDLILRVINNLVSNAVKHTPSGGRLQIEVSARPGVARVAVRDEGRGVPAEIRGRLFEKFAGVHTKDRKAVHSAGLGLAFCKLAVEAHGGTIGVEDAVPKGSVFAFELPV